MTKTAAKTFKATLERLRGNLGWVVAYVPFAVEKTWKVRGREKVRGTINVFEFRTTLFPTREGRHFILVNKRMQAGAGARLGSVAEFRLEPDTGDRVVLIPAELKRLLDEDRRLRRWYDALSYSMRKYFAYLIAGVKSGEARVRRAEQIAECLLSAMEAERELPPMLQAAFARDPRAREGWKVMSPLKRRGHLMGIFYYRNPETRAKRIAKAMEEATQIAEKRIKAKSQRSHM